MTQGNFKIYRHDITHAAIHFFTYNVLQFACHTAIINHFQIQTAFTIFLFCNCVTWSWILSTIFITCYLFEYGQHFWGSEGSIKPQKGIFQGLCIITLLVCFTILQVLGQMLGSVCSNLMATMAIIHSKKWSACIILQSAIVGILKTCNNCTNDLA